MESEAVGLIFLNACFYIMLMIIFICDLGTSWNKASFNFCILYYILRNEHFMFLFVVLITIITLYVYELYKHTSCVGVRPSSSSCSLYMNLQTSLNASVIRLGSPELCVLCSAGLCWSLAAPSVSPSVQRSARHTPPCGAASRRGRNCNSGRMSALKEKRTTCWWRNSLIVLWVWMSFR